MNYLKDFLTLEAKRTRQNAMLLSTFFGSGVLLIVLSSSFFVSMKKDIVEYEENLEERVELLEQQLGEKEAEIRALRANQDQGDTSIEQPPGDDQTEDIAGLKATIKEQYERIKRKENENDQLRDQLTACENRPPAEDTKCQDRIERIIAVKDRVITRLQRQLDDCGEDNDRMKTDCEKAITDCENQRKDCSAEVRKAVSDKNREITRLQNQLKDCEGKVGELQRSLRDCERSANSNCDAAVEEATANKNREINKLEIALKNCQGTDRYRPLYEDCEQSRKEMEREINNLQASLEKISAANRTARQRLSCLEECAPTIRRKCANCY